MFDLIPLSNSQRSLWNMWDNLEKSFFQNAMSVNHFRTDIVDEGGQYVIHAELPGFAREDIKIDIDKGTLTISASHKEETEDKKDNYVRRERRYGSFSRSFDMSEINTESISAKYENGILSLTLPKKEAPPVIPARQIEIL